MYGVSLKAYKPIRELYHKTDGWEGKKEVKRVENQEIKKIEKDAQKLLEFVEKTLNKVIMAEERKEVVRSLFSKIFGVEPRFVKIVDGLAYAEFSVSWSEATVLVAALMPVDREHERGVITAQVSEASAPESLDQLLAWEREARDGLRKAEWFLNDWKDELILDMPHYIVKIAFRKEPMY